jgi:hypothetical protein
MHKRAPCLRLVIVDSHNVDRVIVHLIDGRHHLHQPKLHPKGGSNRLQTIADLRSVMLRAKFGLAHNDACVLQQLWTLRSMPFAAHVPAVHLCRFSLFIPLLHGSSKRAGCFHPTMCCMAPYDLLHHCSAAGRGANTPASCQAVARPQALCRRPSAQPRPSNARRTAGRAMRRGGPKIQGVLLAICYLEGDHSPPRVQWRCPSPPGCDS